MSNLQLFLHLFATLIPVLGVFAFLLLHRRQHIQADLDERRMCQEHGQTMNLLAARKQEAMSSLAQAYAPLVGQTLERFLTKAEAPTLESFETADIVEELERRVVCRFTAAKAQPAPDSDPDEGRPTPVPDNPTLN